MKAAMRTPLIVDGRNLFELDEPTAQGFRYASVGRPTV
jgi:UDPglucose 6-dehydrogenase